MSETTPIEEEKVVTCSIEGVEKMSRDHPNGVLLVFTQKGCPYCPDFLEEAEKTVGSKVAIAESGLEDDDCVSLAKKLNVLGTPQAVYFKEGREVSRLNPLGKTWDQVRVELDAMVKAEVKAQETEPAQDSEPASESSPEYTESSAPAVQDVSA